MAHEIESLDGAAYSLEKAWHGLGTVTDHVMSPAEALGLANLSWQVGLEDVYDRFGNKLGGFETEWKYTVRQDLAETDPARYLGRVTADYTPLQNTEQMAFVEAFIGESGAEIESAFSMRSGRMVAIVARIPEVMQVRDDTLQPYFLTLNTHDGGMKFTGLFTSVRPVCRNTVNMALARSTNQVALRHSGDMLSKVEMARQTLSLGADYFRRQAEELQALAETRIEDAFVDVFLSALYPAAADSKASATLANKQRDKVRGLFYGGQAGAYQEATHGTAYGLLQAVYEKVDHQSNFGVGKEGELARREGRFASLMAGGAKDDKSRAFKLLGTCLAAQDRAFAKVAAAAG